MKTIERCLPAWAGALVCALPRLRGLSFTPQIEAAGKGPHSLFVISGRGDAPAECTIQQPGLFPCDRSAYGG